jgi:hypothetical protein
MSIKEEDTTSRMSLGHALEHSPAASESRQMKESHVSTWWWLRKTSEIDDLDLARIGFIPGCMTTAFWRKQYAQTVQCRTTAASISDIKNELYS